MALFVYETYRWINLGFVKFPTYALFANLSFFLATLLVMYYVKKEKLHLNTAIWILLAGLVGMLLGAKIFYYFGPWSWHYDWSFMYRLSRVWMVWASGLVFYGAFIGTIVAIFLFAKIRKINVLPYLDIMALSLGLVAGMSRIGCWFAGCCAGTPTNVPWAIMRNGVPIHPTQLYYVFAGFSLFFIVLWLHKKRKYYGYTAIIAVFGYAVTRFFIEYFRTDARYYTLTASQWISIVLIIVTVALYVYMRMRLKAHNLPLVTRLPLAQANENSSNSHGVSHSRARVARKKSKSSQK
jgi:phosphatidylglycerol---prolipoprotein diacylglyceryl transferase